MIETVCKDNIFGYIHEVKADGVVIGEVMKTSPNGNITPHCNSYLFTGWVISASKDNKLFERGGFFKTKKEAVDRVVEVFNEVCAKA